MLMYFSTDRALLAGFVIGILGACAGNTTSDDDVGGTSTDQDTDESTDVSTDSSTSEESTDSASDTGDATDTTESESTDASDSTGTDTDSDSTDTTETGETGDPSCADDSYVGVALAEDGWGVGDLCDEIWVCASASQVALVQAAVPGAQCTPGEGCPESHCTLSFQTVIDRPLFEMICDALMIDGIDEAYCVVYGP